MGIAQDTLDRYAALKKFVVVIGGSLNADSRKWKEFSSSHANLILELTQLDAKLTQLQHLDDSVSDANEQKLQKLKVKIW